MLFLISKINNFRGDRTDLSAKPKTLLRAVRMPSDTGQVTVSSELAIYTANNLQEQCQSFKKRSKSVDIGPTPI